ncbi:MAG: hypothetical protein E7436_00745 [Ruminococcaceae bacterium]|nr:hypothetical protein [Oscillospiraceae bacterium]
MENCFRFLINVDQCLNMSHFDIFFYRLQSQHRFHLSQVQLFGDCDDSSLHNAITDIRMYLDKYPYHVGDFQIIVTMRGHFRKDPEHWQETLLFRLMQLEHELRQARIFFNSRERVEKALNFIMLYDVDFSADLPTLERYMVSRRFRQDSALLLKHLGITAADLSAEELSAAAAAYAASPDRDPAATDLLDRFVIHRTRRSELSLAGVDPELVDPMDEVRDPLHVEFTMFLQDQLSSFQVFEAQIDRNNRRQNTLALLRIVEFINRSVDLPTGTGLMDSHPSLLRRCADNWTAVWNDPTLEQQYAAMLARYQIRLRHAADALETPTEAPNSTRALPDENIPANDAITSSETMFSSNDPRRQGTNMKDVLQRFLGRRFSVSKLVSEWDAVYTHLRRSLEQMDHELRVYAEDLSRQYSMILEKRKQESVAWRTNTYVADAHTEKNISRIGYEQEERLQALKSPHMTPTLSFQDQLNMENSLEQANQSIRFYLGCMSNLTPLNYLGLVLTCAGLGILHYTVLQPYVLQDAQTLPFYLMYAGILALQMLLCWRIPYRYYRKKLKKEIRGLQADMDLYISGYFDRAKQFSTYINLLNQLDYLTRYHRLLKRAFHTTHRLSQGYLWHKVQINNHLTKLHFFQGLIALSSETDAGSDPHILPRVQGDHVGDVVDSPVYWPQS